MREVAEDEDVDHSPRTAPIGSTRVARSTVQTPAAVTGSAEASVVPADAVQGLGILPS